MPKPKKHSKKTSNAAILTRLFKSQKAILVFAIVAFAAVGITILRTSSAATNTTSQRLNIVRVAYGEQGILDNSARVHEYTGRSDNPEWCAYYVSWVMQTSGYPLRYGDWRVPAVFKGTDNLKNLFISMGAYQEYGSGKNPVSPQIGDVILFSRSHTGIVTKGDVNGALYTIEGNSGYAGKPNRVTPVTYPSFSQAGVMGWGNVDAIINRVSPPTPAPAKNPAPTPAPAPAPAPAPTPSKNP